MTKTVVWLFVSIYSVLFSERSLQRLALLLDHYGLSVKDLSPEQKENLPAALKQLQMDSSSYAHKQSKGRCAHFSIITYVTPFSLSVYNLQWGHTL